MADNTTQILKEFDEKAETSIWGYEFDAKAFRLWLIKALSQQREEAFQEILDLDSMQDEKEREDYAGMYLGSPTRRLRNKFRAELRQAIAQKKGKV